MKIKIGLIDDHTLFLKSLSSLIATMEEIEVVLEAINGEELIKKINGTAFLPDILLIDVDMPVMNGVQTAAWVRAHFPQVHMVALSMKDEDKAIIHMIQAGCCAYLLKDIHPFELERALKEIQEKGFYNSDVKQRNYARLISGAKEKITLQLTENELQFLQLACSDLTYKQIADKMHKAERTVDGYRERLFDKLQVQSRVGMVLEAIHQKLVTT